MNQPSKLLEHTKVSKPATAIMAIWSRYSSIFCEKPLKPETYQAKYPLVTDCKEVLVEVPSEKQGQYPKENRPNWGRGNQPKYQKFHQSNKSFDTPVDMRLFQTSGLCEDINSKSWYYQDENKQVQGPFNSKDMDTLLLKQVINMQTRVALESLEKFVRIEKIIKVVVNTVQQKPAIVEVPIPPPIDPRIQDPFKLSGLTVDFNAKVWYYKRANDTNGPFDTKTMDQLWQRQHLSEEDRIAFESTTKFVKMEKIIKLAEQAIEKSKEPKVEEPKQEQPKQPEPVFEIDLDYSKIPQRKNLGAWDDTVPKQKGQVNANVVSSSGRNQNQGKTKVRGTEKANSNVNKSMQVEGQHGNLYQKEQEKEVPKQLQKIEETPVKAKVNPPVKQQPQQQQQPVAQQEDDEWTEVGTGQKKRTNLKQIAQNSHIPGLVVNQGNDQQNQKQQKNKQQTQQQQQQQQQQQETKGEDDGWFEVNQKQNKPKK